MQSDISSINSIFKYIFGAAKTALFSAGKIRHIAYETKKEILKRKEKIICNIM